MNIAIIGTGYVGLTTGVCLASIGHSVTCIDTDESKINALKQGRVPIYEPHLAEVMGESKGNLSFTTSYAGSIPEAEVVFIAVGTPSTGSGSPNLEFLAQAARAVGEHIGPGFTVVVNKSTVPIGSGNWVGSLIRESLERKHGRKAKDEFAVASNPEFLREGSAMADSLYPDRIVLGADHPRALEILFTLYRPIIDQTFTPPRFVPRPESKTAVPLVSTDLASAELIKYAANAFLALKISFINEIGNLAERVGAEITEVARGIGLDSRVGPRFLSAGIGWGGSCFGKDTAAVVATASEYGLSMPIIEAARTTNQRQRERVIEKLLAELKILKGRTIGLLGLAFKPNTDDLREAPAIDIARRLIERGTKVNVHDPIAMERFRREFPDLAVNCCSSAEQVADDADAVVLITEWAEYVQLDWDGLGERMRQKLVLDGRYALDREKLARLGFRYIGMSC